MNKKAIFIIGIILLFFGAAFAGRALRKMNSESMIADEIKFKEDGQESKTEEDNDFIDASTEEEKTTPNTEFVLKKYYSDCEHITQDESEIPEEMVNLTENELKENYKEWKVEEFSKDKVVLSKEVLGFCGEHYLLIEEEGKVKIYSLDAEGNKTLEEETEIAVEYLPETDKIILKNGIYIYGEEELNKIREDYES